MKTKSTSRVMQRFGLPLAAAGMFILFAPSHSEAAGEKESLLSKGMEGSQVEELQEKLEERGFIDTVSEKGVFGQNTKEAIKKFQKEHNLFVDGVAGPQTLGAIAVLRIEDKGFLVEALQEILTQLDYYEGEINGEFTEETEKAVLKAQKDFEISVDGIAGPQTLAKLREVATNQGGQQQTGSGNSGNSGGSSTTSPAAFVTNLIAEASLHIGVPYLWGGTTTSGFDCSGYIQYVFKQQGVNLTRTVATQWNAGTAVSQPSVGDVVFFETYTSGPSHNGIYIGNNQFIHSGSSTGVTITSMDNPYWKARYLGAKRLH